MPAKTPEKSEDRSNIRSLFKRPVSVLVVVYTVELDVLLICRKSPEGFWQSVTGSLEDGELPADAAARELLEETGIHAQPVDHQMTRTFPIKPAWRKRYAPGVVENVEHEFSVQLPEPQEVVLDPSEHVDYCWVPILEAIAKVSSHSNRAALKTILAAES